jgi:hypothetical protein
MDSQPDYSGRRISMSKDLVLQLRYLGVIPQAGFVEYGFRIENKDKSTRQVILTIADDFFLHSDLKPQEAPDLCYQKVLLGLDVEKTDSCSSFSVPVTALDIARYRDLHPIAKLRKHLQGNRISTGNVPPAPQNDYVR